MNGLRVFITVDMYQKVQSESDMVLRDRIYWTFNRGVYPDMVSMVVDKLCNE